jgi:hypothetical protein
MAAASSERHRHIGKYKVLKHIATGGMGAVYKAQDTETGQEVALKVLPHEYSVRPNVLERFRREARNGSKLRHPNIATIYDCGEAQDLHFLVMEFVDGINLLEYIGQHHGRLDLAEAIDILTQVLSALAFAHQQGIVHRDIKPSNILIDRKDGTTLAKMIDFGLSLQTREDEFRVTRDGTTVGTVDYLAPEQARDSRAADIRSDIYSLGCSLFHMLAGRAPFAEGSLTERVLKHMEAQPPDLRRINPEVSDSLWAVCRRMLAKSPAQRYQTPAEVLDALQKLDSAGAAAPQEPVTTAASAGETAANLPVIAVDGQSETHSTPLAEDTTPATFEQQKAAHQQFQRAAEVIASGNLDYGRQLLRACCRLEPANLTYRHALRLAQQELYSKRRRHPLRAWLSSLGFKFRMYLALMLGKNLRVLQLGEEVLVRRPADTGVQLGMARAADAAGFTNLARWLLEQAREQEAHNVRLNRALAVLCEKQRDYHRAVYFWQLVSRAEPANLEASQKVKNLSARDTIDRGSYEKRADLRQLRVKSPQNNS